MINKSCRGTLIGCVTLFLAWGANADPPQPAAGYIAALPPLYWIGGEGLWSDPENWINLDLSQPGQPLLVIIDTDVNVDASVTMDVNAAVATLDLGLGDALTVDDGHTLSAKGLVGCASFFSSGLVVVGSQGQPTRILIEDGGRLILSGGGELQLHSQDHSSIEGEFGTETLHIEDHLVRGTGRLQGVRIINTAVVQADAYEQRMDITPSADGIESYGVFRAFDGGVLRMQDGIIINVAGTIEAADKSRVELEGFKVYGGLLTSEGTGFLRTQQTPSLLDGITLEGVYELGPTALTLVGIIINEGLIAAVAGATLTGDPLISELIIPAWAGDVWLGGSGVMQIHKTKLWSGSTSLGGSLVNGPQHTITGNGLLGFDTVTFDNFGAVHADGDAPIVIDPIDGQTSLNAGTYLASGSGGLVFTDGAFDSPGVIEVRPGSKAIFTAAATLSNNFGGTLTSGTWRVISDGAPTTLNIPGGGIVFNEADVTLSGTGSTFQQINGLAFNSGSFSLLDGKQFQCLSSFTNQGQLNILDGAALLANGTFMQSVPGALQIELGDAASGSAAAPIVATSLAFLGGVLEITLDPDAELAKGQPIPIIQATGFVGWFDQIVAPPGVQVSVLGNKVVATITAQ